jgi:hypothetical protein
MRCKMPQIDVNQGGSMWIQNAASNQASQKYQMKTQGKGNYQKERSLAAEQSYAQGVMRAAQTGARARAVQNQDPTKYERNIAAKGVANRIQGIQAAGAGSWIAGYGPYAPVVDSIRAGFGPKSPDAAENVTRRVLPLAVGLQNAKRGGGGGSTYMGATGGRAIAGLY